MWNRRKTDKNENKIKEPTEDGQACEHNKIFEERCGNKHETITVVSLLFINLVIHCHHLALRIFMSSQHLKQNRSSKSEYLISRKQMY